MKKIDAHAHIGQFGSWANVGITTEEMIALMDEYNIQKTIICSQDHEAIQEAVIAYPDRFIPLVYPDPTQGTKATELVRTYLENHHFKGIKLHPLGHSFIANDPIVHPIMDIAKEYRIPVFIHCGHPPFSLPWSIGLLAEQYPEVNIVMVHMGHGHGVYIQGSIETAMKYPNLYLETSGMPMHTKIKEAYEKVGADRVLFGTDIPFHHPSVEIQRTMVSGLNQDELDNIFYNNCAKLMNLK